MTLRSRFGFVLRFFAIAALSYLLIALKPVDREIVTPFTAGLTTLSAAALSVLGDPVSARGTVLRSDRFAVDIKNGCNGVEAMLLLLAAVAAFPAPWKNRLVGIAAGIMFIQLVNLVRIGTLFVLGRDYPHLFETFHVVVWQAVVFLLTIGIFLVWSSNVAKQTRASGA